MRALIFTAVLTTACHAGALRAANPAQTAASCNVILSPLVFPPYDGSMPAATSAIGTVEIDCPPGVQSVQPRIVLTPGGSGRAGDRRMASGKGSLRYNLYLEPSHVRVAGDGSDGSTAITLPSTQSHGHSVYTIYGAILPGQAVAAGQYSDSVTAQLEF